MKTSHLVSSASLVFLTAATASAAIGYNRFQYQVPAGTANANRFRVNLPAPAGMGNAYSHLVLRRPTIGGTLRPGAVPAAGGMTADISGNVNNNAANPAFTIARNNSLDVYTRTVVKDSWSFANSVQFFNAAAPAAAVAVDNTPAGGWRAQNLPNADSSGLIELSVNTSSPSFLISASIYRGMSYAAIESAFDAFFNASVNTPDIPDNLLSNPGSHFSGAVLADSFGPTSLNGGDTLSVFFSNGFGADEGVIVLGTVDLGGGNVREFAVAMAVPTPGAGALISLAGLCAVRRRR